MYSGICGESDTNFEDDRNFEDEIKETLCKPVGNVDLNAYSGIWQQVMTSRSTGLNGTGIDFSSVEAIYTPKKSDKSIILVTNRGYNGDFEYVEIKGESYAVDPLNPSIRKVKFYELPRFTEGDYWIVKLGPIINNKYDYAVVVGPNFFDNKFSLYVLARNRDKFFKQYFKETNKFLKQNGFTKWWNKPVISPDVLTKKKKKKKKKIN